MMPNQDEELRRLVKLMHVTLKNADKRLRIKLIFSMVTMLVSMSIFLVTFSSLIVSLMEQGFNTGLPSQRPLGEVGLPWRSARHRE